MRFILLAIFSIIIFSIDTNAQLSQGGSPIEVPQLKSTGIPVVRMPVFKNEYFEKSVAAARNKDEHLKPFRFAHPFEVNLSPANSGEWHAVDGYNVWKLKLKSEGAKSLNLIFDRFELNEEARLFIYNPAENYFLGAFTALNNKQSGKFAVSPVAGDELIVQYEVPSKFGKPADFEIIRVNHDYIGILKSDRRPLGETAGACNVEVNCDVGKEWKETKNAVCRLIVNGAEVCTGTLVNNTAEDQKPYVLSASHCYDKWEYAETTVYTFNYESPFCAPLDGDPLNSISGAIMKAQFDSLDFALTELSQAPPADYRPYYAGWSRSETLPDSSVSIHHPYGDIKKIALDYDRPSISDFNSKYTRQGFLRIARWEEGVTEKGSSGGPLFNTKSELIGTLTGGAATCADPVNDYYQWFQMSWDYKSDSTQQLKHWLDPTNSGEESLSGKQFNKDEDLCISVTNLSDEDDYKNVALTIANEHRGYWGGTNNVGITEIAERYSIPGNKQLSGVFVGVGKILDNFGGGDSRVTLKVYNGSEFPESLIYAKEIAIKDLYNGAMNYIRFDQEVEPADTFFVGFDLRNVMESDTFVVYQSIRQGTNKSNYFYLKQNGSWEDFRNLNNANYVISNVFELIACGIDREISDTPVVNNPLEIVVYPNPTFGKLTVEAGKGIEEESIQVYNLMGRLINPHIEKIQNRKLLIDLSGQVSGVYLIRFSNGEGYVTRKVSYVSD